MPERDSDVEIDPRMRFGIGLAIFEKFRSDPPLQFLSKIYAKMTELLLTRLTSCQTRK